MSVGRDFWNRRADRVAAPESARLQRFRTLYVIAAAVLAALVPLILFAGLWIRQEFANEQRDLEVYVSDQARTLAARLDAQMRQQLSVLQAVAALPSLDQPDLTDFHTAAIRMLSSMPDWVAIALIDPGTGRQVLHTEHPVGADLPVTTAPEVVRSVVDKRQPAFHTRYAGGGGLYGGHAVLLYTPVVRDNAVRSVVSATVKAEAIQQLMPRDQEPHLMSVVIDERGRVLARSRTPEQFIGQEASEALRRATAGRSSGIEIIPTLNGEKVFTAFQRSPLTNWLAVAAASQDQFDALSRRSTGSMLISAALSLILAGVLAAFLFETMMERRVSNERLAASRALSELDARLLATSQNALAEQRKAAQEREVLLREIYHRVKNNLQIIQSLLRLGSQNLSPDQREPFEMAVRRIGAMARVHTLLYNSPDLASIDFKEYLEEIVRETAEAYGADQRGIRTVLEAESIRIPLDIAIPLAFIAVELLTNAFKHAFPAGRAGEITVRASRQGDRGVLVLADNGVGLPATGRKKRALGLNLVGKLVEQINGTLEGPEPGQAAYRVTFPLTPAHAPPLPDPSNPQPAGSPRPGSGS